MMNLSRPAVDYYNNPLNYNYTGSQVKTALHSPNRVMMFRYNLLDMNNNFKKKLANVTGGSITHDYTQQIKRTARFDMKDDGSINFLSDRIQPFALLKMSDGNYAQFPLGIFLLSTAPQQTDAALVVTRQVQAYDQSQILTDWKTTDRYTIAAGTNYITAVKTLLNNAGITNVNLTATSYTLPTTLDYPGGTSYLEIINGKQASGTSSSGTKTGLLQQINYKPLWFDENGTAIAQPWVDPSTVAPGYTYQDDSNSVTLPQVNRQMDLFSVPNVWVVCVAQTDQATIVSTYTNSNANSPTSTVNRGREIVHFEQNLNAPLSTALQDFSKRLAFEDSQVYETIVYETAIMPIHQDYDVVNFTFSALGVSNNYTEMGWSFPFNAGATMSHTIRKIIPV